MSTTRYLVDTSAFVRITSQPAVRAAWKGHAEAGSLGVTPVTELEIMFSARSKKERDGVRRLLEETYAWVLPPDRTFARALEVQNIMFDRGTHRSAGPVDLLVAATAEVQGMTLLHYDADFEQIAEVTGQPMRWVADRGSVD